MNSATLAAAALKAQRQLDGLSSAPRNRLPRIDSVGNLGGDSNHLCSLIFSSKYNYPVLSSM